MVVGCWNGYQGLFDWTHWYYLISIFLPFCILRQNTCDFSFIVFFFLINCIFVSQIVLMRCVFDVLQLLFKQSKIWLKVILQGELNLASMLPELVHCIGILLVQIFFTPNLQVKKNPKPILLHALFSLNVYIFSWWLNFRWRRSKETCS